MTTSRTSSQALIGGLVTLLLVWSLPASATDFAVENRAVVVSNGAFSTTGTLGANGTVTPAPSIPITAGDFGMPSFAMALDASAIDTGEHVFWAAVEITGNNNDKYLRAFLDEVFITVAGDGSFTGEVRASTNLTVRVESEGDFLQIELDDQADASVGFSGETFLFNASNLLSLLGAADGQSANWQAIAEDFQSNDSYHYKIYLAPRDYGVQGARIGIINGGSFSPLPLQPAPFLNNEQVFVIEGDFSTTGSTSEVDAARQNLPVISTVIGPAGSQSVTLRGGVRGGSSAEFFQQAAFSVGESIALQFLLTPAPAHVGSQALIILGITLESDPGTIYMFGADGSLTPFTGQQIVGAAQIQLGADNLLSIPAQGEILLTPGLGDVYRFFIGYQLLATGELYYGAEPVLVDVAE